MMVMGGIIGAGIFLNPAIVAQRVGTAGLTLGVWVLGGAVALAGAFCFGELGARRPRAGGGYVYLRDAFGPLPAFLYGWTLLLVIATGAIAAVAVTFARYAAALFGLGGSWVIPMAIVAIGFLSAVNYRGVRPGATTQNLFTILKLVALAGLIVAGVAAPMPDAAVASVGAPAAGPGTMAATIAVIGIALVPVLFSYGGWQQTNFVAEEIVDARRSLPRALVLGVSGVVLVYVLANLAYVRQLGVAGLAASQAPAADVMRQVLGPAGASFISAGIVASTFGFLNLVILVSPRVYQAMADDGVFFRAAANLHPRFRTPTRAIIFQAGWAIVLTLSGTYAQLLDYVVFGDWIFFGLTVATLFWYRRHERSTSEGEEYRTPGYPIVPALFVAVAVYVVISSVASNPTNALFGTLLIGLGVPVFYYWRRRGRDR
jgi:APA family basic amino acid/polyamine antiporter